MNPFEFVIALLVIITIGSIVKARYGAHSGRLGRRRSEDEDVFVDTAENKALREEVRALKDRLQVLERITVEKENSLAREIEGLRDR